MRHQWRNAPEWNPSRRDRSWFADFTAARYPLPRRHRVCRREHSRQLRRERCTQCTANGYGERTGNADLFSVIGNLQLKMGRQVLPDESLKDMVRVSHAIADLANLTPTPTAHMSVPRHSVTRPDCTRAR